MNAGAGMKSLELEILRQKPEKSKYSPGFGRWACRAVVLSLQ
jgi:hypothetical protein